MTTEYLKGLLTLIPGRYRTAGVWQRELRQAWGEVTLSTVPIPHDSTNGSSKSYIGVV